MKVVIVDDEWYSLDLTYRLLTQIRLDLEVVAFFQDPKEALEQIPVIKPDLIILDLEMPHINGMELYEKLKYMDSSFLMLSAYGETYFRDRIWNKKVGILTKPFSKSDMSTMLNAMEKVSMKGS